jgi:sugar-specific transcriptional regulator TrmB
MEEEIITRLRDVGFSLYEARLYVALLREGSQNGNEVAKSAAVPSSKVYATLDKLAAAGIVQSMRQGTSTRWAAVPPEEVIGRLRRVYNEPLDFLTEQLPKLEAVEPSEPFLTLSGLTAMHHTVAALLGTSRTDVQIACWTEDLEALREPLLAAHERGVSVFGTLYGDADAPPGSWLHHSYQDIVAERMEGRLLALVVDDRETVIAYIPVNGNVSAVRSRNPAMTLIVREYLHHDRMMQRAQMAFGFNEWDRWWRSDPDARAEILGRTIGGLRNGSSAKRRRSAAR